MLRTTHLRSVGSRVLLGAFALLPLAAASAYAQSADTAAELYRTSCAACHGHDGRGAPVAQVGFDEPLPDFTDCTFATREPDADWFAVAHQGGQTRAFARMMPAFGEVLDDDEIALTVAHVRTFCRDPLWPRGDLNLPRALVTEKAFVEDEAVLEASSSTTGSGSAALQIVYEKRFGRRNQFEIAVPFAWRRSVPGHAQDSRVGGLGDVAVAWKRVLHANHQTGTILSFVGEVVLPTGDEEEGFGRGTPVIEPFLTWGQILPKDAFLQAQVGFELPTDSGFDDEGILRVAFGRSFSEGRFGRTWSPMVEILGSRDLRSGAREHWDLVPQLQVTLSQRQHVIGNVGVRLPLDGSGDATEVLFYVLWDWFDGGLFDGW
jgi:mono/diheme cytochrome c family protein